MLVGGSGAKLVSLETGISERSIAHFNTLDGNTVNATLEIDVELAGGTTQ